MALVTVCQLINYGGFGPGSFIPSLVSLARALGARGDRFVVLGTEVPGANWAQLLRSAGAEVHLSRDLVVTLRRLFDLRPDVVHAHFSRFDLAAASVRGKSRIFWHIHSVRESDAFSVRSKMRAFVKNRLIGTRIEKIIVPSRFVAAEAARWFAPAEKLVIVHNGIDTDHFRPPSDAERSAARADVGISADQKVVLFFERLPLKGGDLLRAALEKTPNLRLIVVGGTETMRLKFGSLPRVIAIDYAKDVRRLYWAADLLAFPSRKEAFGFVAAEALTCGLPVAASNIPPLREILEGATGVESFDPEDASSFAAALYRLSARGRLSFSELDPHRFAVRKWTEKIVRLYDRADEPSIGGT